MIIQVLQLKLPRTQLLSSLWTCVYWDIRLEMLDLHPQVNGDHHPQTPPHCDKKRYDLK